MYLVESTVSAKALRWESTWMLKGHNRGQCDGNGVGERRRRQVLAMPGQVVRPHSTLNRNKCPELGYDIPCSLFGVKPSGPGLLGDNPESSRGLRVSGLAATGAHVFRKSFQLAQQFFLSHIPILWPMHEERLLAQDVGVTVEQR